MHSARCADNLLYDEPPCTDYADPLPPRITRLAADVSIDGALVSSPVELFHTAAGLPVLLTLAVLMMHLLCCALQSACGSGSDEAYDTFATSARTPREEVKEAIALGGQRRRTDKSPLIGAPGMGVR